MYEKTAGGEMLPPESSIGSGAGHNPTKPHNPHREGEIGVRRDDQLTLRAGFARGGELSQSAEFDRLTSRPTEECLLRLGRFRQMPFAGGRQHGIELSEDIVSLAMFQVTFMAICPGEGRLTFAFLH